MKNITNKMLAIIAISSAVIFACNSSEKKVENAKEELKEARQELNDERIDSIAEYETFKAESELRIQQNEKVISAYRERVRKEKRIIKKEDQMYIDLLEQKNINMRIKIEEFRTKGKDEWKSFKQEFKRDMDELGAALKNLTVKNTK